MRGNGLSADAYIAVADLDPGTADALLAALRDRGVAAYAAASPEPVPDGDTDRLYVDVAAVEQARALITVELAAPDPADGLDRLDLDDPRLSGADRWTARSWTPTCSTSASAPPARTTSTGSTWRRSSRRSWPASTPPPRPATRGRSPRTSRPTAGGPTPTSACRTGPTRGQPCRAPRSSTPGAASAPPSGIGWEDLLRPVPAAEPEPGPGYVPPPPPPLPHASLGTRAAWAAVLGGPALLFLAVLLGWHLADWVMLAAAVSFLGGFVALVARLGDGPDDPDDDGAVV